MDFLYEIGLFALKTLIIVGSIAGVLVALLVVLVQMVSSNRHQHEASIVVEKLNTRFRNLRHQLHERLLSKKAFKKLTKQEKKSDKKQPETRETKVFVLKFVGDIRASAVEALREEVTALISVAKPEDEVVLRLESGGGLVTSYGLAAAQLERLKAHGLRLTICVDKVAASGGYMMACVAHRILAAPFAVLGSIGVIAQVPNFNKILRKNDIEYREVTAGEFKRTVTLFGEITEPGLQKFRAQIEDTHILFKNYVRLHRPAVDIDRVATGEHWYGTQALELGLIDSVTTSDEYIYKFFDIADVYEIEYKIPKKLMQRLTGAAAHLMDEIAVKVLSSLERRRVDY